MNVNDVLNSALACQQTGQYNQAEKLCRQITTAAAKLWQENQSEGASLYFLDPDGHKLEVHTSDLKARLHYKRLHATPDMCFFTQDETTKPGKETVNQ